LKFPLGKTNDDLSNREMLPVWHLLGIGISRACQGSPFTGVT